jgi:hypothetical protein
VTDTGAARVGKIRYGPNTYFESGAHQEMADLQNHQLLLTFGGKKCFAPNADTAKRVLDVGTGTGIWAVEFGTSSQSHLTITITDNLQPTNTLMPR